MKFKVYQINFTNAQVNRINDRSKPRPDFYNRYLDTTFQPTQEAITAAKDLYCHVCDIKADDLDMVFRIGNLGPEESITCHRQMHSLSVGDVIVDELGVAHLVQSFGFDVINF